MDVVWPSFPTFLFPFPLPFSRSLIIRFWLWFAPWSSKSNREIFCQSDKYAYGARGGLIPVLLLIADIRSKKRLKTVANVAQLVEFLHHGNTQVRQIGISLLVHWFCFFRSCLMSAFCPEHKKADSFHFRFTPLQQPRILCCIPKLSRQYSKPLSWGPWRIWNYWFGTTLCVLFNFWVLNFGEKWE